MYHRLITNEKRILYGFGCIMMKYLLSIIIVVIYV